MAAEDSRIRQADSLAGLRDEIEAFLASTGQPLFVEDGVELFDLSTAQWKLSVEFGKLILEVWNSAGSLTRRIEGLTYRDRRRMELLVRKRAARGSSVLEVRDARAANERRPGAVDHRTRLRFQREFLAMLGREFPAWRVEGMSHRSDREHSFSAWYSRGWARQGSTAWAFLGLNEAEAPAASDAALVFGLIWLDWLRHRTARPGRACVSGLKLFLPRTAVEASAHRAAHLDPGSVRVEILEWNGGPGRPVPVDLRDYGNVETRLSPRRDGEALIERHLELLSKLLAPRDSPLLQSTVPRWQSTISSSSEWSGAPQRKTDRTYQAPAATPLAAPQYRLPGRAGPQALACGVLDMVPDVSASLLSLRICGLEVARIEGGFTPRVRFGLEGSRQTLHGEDPAEFQSFLSRVTRFRRPRSEDPSHEFYRLQSERWLESLLVRDLTKIDPALLSEFVYPQVPAFAGAALSVEAVYGEAPSESAHPAAPELTSDHSRMTRGVIDILSAVRSSAPGGDYRLAVIELKVHEEINLPLQGLDYWLRVKWLQERRQFKQFGYFPGIELSSAPPLLYFVSPAFRFHSTTERLIGYLSHAVEVILFGINDQWREGIKVLFRRQLRPGSLA